MSKATDQPEHSPREQKFLNAKFCGKENRTQTFRGQKCKMMSDIDVQLITFSAHVQVELVQFTLQNFEEFLCEISRFPREVSQSFSANFR